MVETLRYSLPLWDALSDIKKDMLISKSMIKTYSDGVIFYHNGGECMGTKIMKSGRARVFISSPDGKEITLEMLLREK